MLTLNLKLCVYTAAPKFKTPKDGPYDVNVTEGESATFNCNAFAKPLANIVWLQYGEPIDSELLCSLLYPLIRFSVFHMFLFHSFHLISLRFNLKLPSIDSDARSN